jgi:hypothetical protein
MKRRVNIVIKKVLFEIGIARRRSAACEDTVVGFVNCVLPLLIKDALEEFSATLLPAELAIMSSDEGRHWRSNSSVGRQTTEKNVHREDLRDRDHRLLRTGPVWSQHAR